MRLILLLYVRNFKPDKFPVLKICFYLYRVTANFTIFDIGLLGNGGIQQHRNFFPTVRALKKMFQHRMGITKTFQVLPEFLPRIS